MRNCLRIALSSTLLLMLPSVASAASLSASVGPGFTISMQPTSTAGTYTVTVSDQSASHNFHLSGPGVNRSTGVGFVGTQTWTVTLSAGTYRYQCDPHSADMNGSFTVASAGNTNVVTDASNDTFGTSNGELPRTGARLKIVAALGFCFVLLGMVLHLIGRREQQRRLVTAS